MKKAVTNTLEADAHCTDSSGRGRPNAFTLVELLVVISVIGVLMGVLLPALVGARSQARQTVCRSNIRQLALAGMAYALANDGYYVAGAADMWDDSGLVRWHGRRDSKNEPFESARGPLAGYLGDGKVKNCSEKTDLNRSDDWEGSFEKGCGGYGYNMTYVGSRMWRKGGVGLDGWKKKYELTARMGEVRRPADTLFFTDTAISKEAGVLIEYSFAEPPYAAYDGQVMTTFRMTPSIHFRHRGGANVGWVDGHVDWRKRGGDSGENVYGVNSADMGLGWFDPMDNTLFDLE